MGMSGSCSGGAGDRLLRICEIGLFYFEWIHDLLVHILQSRASMRSVERCDYKGYLMDGAPCILFVWQYAFEGWGVCCYFRLRKFRRKPILFSDNPLTPSPIQLIKTFGWAGESGWGRDIRNSTPSYYAMLCRNTYAIPAFVCALTVVYLCVHVNVWVKVESAAMHDIKNDANINFSELFWMLMFDSDW